MTSEHFTRPGLDDLTRRYLALLAELPPDQRDASLGAHRSAAVRGAFGPNLLPRPVFLDHDRRRRIAADLAALYRVLTTLPQRLAGSDSRAFATLVGLRPDQVAMIEALSGPEQVPYGRADLYRAVDGFRLLEFNLSSAVGGYELGELGRALMEHEPLRRFTQQERLHCPEPLARIAGMLRRLAGDQGDPVVGVIDWPESYRDNEVCLQVTAELLAGYGVTAVAGHIGDLVWSGGRLYLRGRRIDVIYRFFGLSELTSGPAAAGLAAPVLRAYAAGAVRLFVPLNLAYVANKRALALLFDPECRASLDRQEIALVDRLVPWTRQVPSSDRDPDLIAHCRAHREQLVLKASRMHGGSGTLIGWRTNPDRWDRALAATGGTGAVVQRRVPAVAEPFPVPGTTDFQDWTVNWGMFVVDGCYAGTFVRASPTSTAGDVSFHNGASTGCCLDADGTEVDA